MFNQSLTTLAQYPGGIAGSYTIPNSVTNIGDYAFLGCYGLTSATIPTSGTSIGSGAFEYCGSLTNVTIGNSVTNIGDSAFYSCTNLTSVTIANGITTLGTEAFSSFPSLISVTIPSSVTNIEDSAFSGCSSLISVTIGTNVTSIGELAFYSCTSLTNITIPNSVTSIRNSAFYDCTSLTAITVDTNNPAYSSLDGVLLDKSQTTLIECPAGKGGSCTIPNSVTSIDDYAFSNCQGLTSVMIGSGVTSIGDSAFSGCSGLTSVTIGNSVTSIGDDAFYGCANLTSVYFQGNAPSLGADVFVEYFLRGWTFFDPATVYYLPGTTGWGSMFGGLPAFVWDPNAPTIGVNGASGPWDLSLNPSYPYGIVNGYAGANSNLPPTVVDSSSGVSFTAGYLLSIRSLTPGQATLLAGGDGMLWSDANGVTGWSMGDGSPAHYIPGTVFLEELIGTFAFNGVIVGTPFAIGNGPITVTIPPGANQMLLGVCDNWYNDNGGSVNVSVMVTTPPPSIASFGVRTNQFRFNITGTSGMTVVVEACTDLANHTCNAVSTNTLTGGSFYFSDPQWTNYPARFYRIRSW